MHSPPTEPASAGASGDDSPTREGWSGIKNGALIKRIEASGFDAFVTMDRSLPSQQTLGNCGFATILLRARSNKLDILLPPAILDALAILNAGDIIHVS